MPPRREPAMDKAREGYRAISVLPNQLEMYPMWNCRFKSIVHLITHAKEHKPFPFPTLLNAARKAFVKAGLHALVDQFFTNISKLGKALPYSTFVKDHGLMPKIMRADQVLHTVGMFVDEGNFHSMLLASWEERFVHPIHLRAAIYHDILKMWEYDHNRIAIKCLLIMEIEVLLIHDSVYMQAGPVERRNSANKVVIMYCYALKALETAARLLFPTFCLDSKREIANYMQGTADVRAKFVENVGVYMHRITSLEYTQTYTICNAVADDLDALGDRLKKTSKKLRTVTDLELFQPPKGKLKMLAHTLDDAKAMKEYHKRRISTPDFVAFKTRCLTAANELQYLAVSNFEDAVAIRPVVAALREVRLLEVFIEPVGKREVLLAALHNAERLKFAISLLNEYEPGIEEEPRAAIIAPIARNPSSSPRSSFDARQLIDGDHAYSFALAARVLQDVDDDEVAETNAAKSARTAKRKKLQKAARRREQERKAQDEQEVGFALSDLLGAVCLKVINDNEQERQMAEAADAILNTLVTEMAAELIKPRLATANAQNVLLATASKSPSELDPEFIAKFMQIYAPSLVRFARDDDGIDPLIGACQVCMEPFDFTERKPFYLKCCAQANCGVCIQAILTRQHGQHKLEFDQDDPLVHQWVVLRKELGLPVPRYDQ